MSPGINTFKETKQHKICLINFKKMFKLSEQCKLEYEEQMDEFKLLHMCRDQYHKFWVTSGIKGYRESILMSNDMKELPRFTQ